MVVEFFDESVGAWAYLVGVGSSSWMTRFDVEFWVVICGFGSFWISEVKTSSSSSSSSSSSASVSDTSVFIIRVSCFALFTPTFKDCRA